MPDPSLDPERPRLMGLETEYGCLVREGLSAHEVIGRLRDWFFDQNRYGLIDKHHRDWDEPPGNGGFLFNGGRVYEDMGHLEMCTPECASFRDVLRYDRANDALLVDALKELEMEDDVSIIRNNIDHYTGATFGCHENYSMNRRVPLPDTPIFSLLSFLTLRALYSGAGRVGGLETQRQFMREDSDDLLAEFDGFQITQRADYVENDFFRWVQGNRAIINTRDEPLADPDRFRRLHLLHGDTNVLPAATFLKLGSTSMVLDLLEMGALPEHRLSDPVKSLRRLSYRPTGPWQVDLHNGTTGDVLEILEDYRKLAAKHFQDRDEETNAVLALWERVNTALASSQPEDSLTGILDWVTKHFLFRHFCESEGILMRDPWLESQDLEFHHVSSERSLGLPLAADGYWSEDLDQAIATAKENAPADTRAAARSRYMREIRADEDHYVIDWDGIRWNDRAVSMSDPHDLSPEVMRAPENADEDEPRDEDPFG